MCLEDLRLGRGRFPGRSFFVLAGNTSNGIIPPNGRRVALIFSCLGANAITSGGDVYASDQIVGTPVFSVWQGGDPFQLKLEDVGVLVQSAFSIDASLLNVGQIQVLEILTNQVIDPLPTQV